MKKFVALLCMLTCVLSLTACGQEYVPTDVEKAKAEKAVSMAKDVLLPYMATFFDDAQVENIQDNYNVHEVEDMVESDLAYGISGLSQVYGMSFAYSKIDVEGNAILNGMVSYNNTFDSLYEKIDDVSMNTMGEATYEVSGDEIIVTVPLTGTKKDPAGNLRTAKAEFIFSNDIFLTLKAASLNLDQSLGELMAKAAMDTAMGMGTVFAVLILISCIIWTMGAILSPKKPTPKAEKVEKKEKKQDIKRDAVDNTIAQIIEKEESADDKELVAVIAAAIAAYEGNQSTSGFVVRSIRKRR